MKPEGSLPYSQVSTCPYPEPARSIPNAYITTSWRSILVLSSHRRLGLPSSLFLSGFPIKTLHTPLLSTTLATCPAHLILLDFITQIILGEEYRSFSSSLFLISNPCYLVPLRPKYSPQHPILTHPQPTFLPQFERPSVTPNTKLLLYTVAQKERIFSK